MSGVTAGARLGNKKQASSIKPYRFYTYKYKVIIESLYVYTIGINIMISICMGLRGIELIWYIRRKLKSMTKMRRS